MNASLKHRRLSFAKARGFTLVESIIAIVIFGFAMVTLTTLLFPQIEDSARPHYEVRATALAHSLMTEVLARGYDNNSDPDGGMERCGEGSRTCSTTLGPDAANGEVNNTTKQRSPENFNDVDDYIGCWFTNEASKSYCEEAEVGKLTDILGADISRQYPNFAVNISVERAAIDGANIFKKVTLKVTAGRYGSYTFSGLRGNY